MNLPKFTATSALSRSTRSYRGQPRFGSYAQSGQAAFVVHPSQLEAEVLDEAEETGLLGDEEGGDAEELAADGADEGDADEEAGDDDDSEGEGIDEGAGVE